LVVNGTDLADGVVVQRQEVVNQRRIAQKVLAALLDSSSHWTLLLSQHKEQDDASSGDAMGVGTGAEEVKSDATRKPSKEEKPRKPRSPKPGDQPDTAKRTGGHTFVASTEEETGKKKKGFLKRLRKKKSSG